MRASSFLLVAAFTLGACGPSGRELRIARARAETRMLAASLDRLEERLLAGQARVRLWQELRDRHERVSAIACASQEAHAVAMELHRPPPEDERAERSPRARVVAIAPEAARPLPRGAGAP